VGVGAADLAPAGKRPVADRLDPGISARVVAEQDVVGAVAVEVADTDYREGSSRAADLVPAGSSAIADLLDPGVA
jgi:hypothetical protein